MNESGGAPAHPPASGPLWAVGQGPPSCKEQGWSPEEAEPPGLSSGESGPLVSQFAPWSSPRAAPAQNEEVSGAPLLPRRRKRGMLDWAQFPLLMWLFPDLFEHRLQF